MRYGTPHPVHPMLRAAVWCVVFLVAGMLALSQCGCTIGQTRVAFGASLAADGVTTGIGLRNGGHGANPVIAWNPAIALIGLSLITVAIAEWLAAHGQERAASTLYTISTAVHSAAAAWNVTQLR